MSPFRPPSRGPDPLGVLAMAAALVAAAVAGAALGFGIDFVSGGSSQSQTGARGSQ